MIVGEPQKLLACSQIRPIFNAANCEKGCRLNPRVLLVAPRHESCLVLNSNSNW